MTEIHHVISYQETFEGEQYTVFEILSINPQNLNEEKSILRELRVASQGRFHSLSRAQERLNEIAEELEINL